jgi:hypothetical protein
MRNHRALGGVTASTRPFEAVRGSGWLAISAHPANRARALRLGIEVERQANQAVEIVVFGCEATWQEQLHSELMIL